MKQFKKVRLIVSDFDGVMTDNRVLVSEDGLESVFCNRSDGLAIEILKRNGIDVVVISKETNKVVQTRCRKLGLEVYNAIENKVDLLKKLVQEKGIARDQVCYVGNEINDLDCMKEVDLSVAPADSHQSVLKIASYVTRAKGGEGVIREISDLILL